MEDKRNEEEDCISDSRFKGVVSEHNDHSAEGNGEFSYKQLFQKELTPSDVENSRLVIPMKYATEFFPQVQQHEEVSFYDTSSTLWKFRFFYCKSSQKCTFTRGWPKFVRHKGLKPKDVIVFNLCEFKKNGAKEACNAFVIDVLPMNHHQQEEMRAQPIDPMAERNPSNREIEHKTDFDRDDEDEDEDKDTLTPILLFGKQIGWSKTKKANGS